MSEKNESAAYVVVHRFRLARRWFEEGETLELSPAAASGPLSQGLVKVAPAVKKTLKKTEGEN